MSVRFFDTARLTCRSVVQGQRLGREILHQRSAPLLPVRTLEKHKKVVAADMANKISMQVDMKHGQACKRPDHFVATPVAVVVVEDLEIV